MAPKAIMYAISSRPPLGNRTARRIHQASVITARAVPSWGVHHTSSQAGADRFGDHRGLGCLALGWWQWTRFHSPSGTFQNLGYALQWPLFAWFCVYAYRNFVRYEESPPQPRNSDAVTEIPAELLPERPKPVQQPATDPALREYNAYLAELAKQDAEKENRTTA